MNAPARWLLSLLAVGTAAACPPVQYAPGDFRPEDDGRFRDAGGYGSSGGAPPWDGGSTSSGAAVASSSSPGVASLDALGCPVGEPFVADVTGTSTLAAHGATLVTLLPEQQVLVRDGAVWRVNGGLPNPATGVGVLGTGEFVTSQNGQLRLLTREMVLPVPVADFTRRMDVQDAAILVPGTGGVWDVDGATLEHHFVGGAPYACFAPAVTRWNGQPVTASPGWPQAMVHDGNAWVALTPHGLFDEATRYSTGAWAVAPSRRFLAPAPPALVEVVTFGGQARLLVHTSTTAVLQRVDLPSGGYQGLLVHDGMAVLIRSLAAGDDVVTVGLAAPFEVKVAPLAASARVLGMTTLEGGLLFLLPQGVLEAGLSGGDVVEGSVSPF